MRRRNCPTCCASCCLTACLVLVVVPIIVFTLSAIFAVVMVVIECEDVKLRHNFTVPTSSYAYEFADTEPDERPRCHYYRA